MKNETFVMWNNNILTVEPFNQLDDRLIVGFSTRKNGYSIKPYDSLNLGLHVYDKEKNVISNRKKVADVLQMPLSNWVFSEQIHSHVIKKVTKQDSGAGTFVSTSALKGADGLYTGESNVLLASLYADCVPLYFYSPNHKFVGLAHAGWKGTVGKIGPNMVRLWTEDEGISLDSIYVAIGPSISQESYEVDDFVIDKVKKVLTDTDELPYKKISETNYLLDLKQLNKLLLVACGIEEKHIFVSSYCTYKEEELFFSYRRNKQTGRMMSFIGMK